MLLQDISNEDLDSILGMSLPGKKSFFAKMINKHFPELKEEDPMYKDTLEAYLSSFYVEKLYRSNKFFQEKFVMVYTNTGLVRNVINELYFTDDHLITH
jgi:hypothetical protein|tara:strand:- start:279 stop:575 length:297 start_codon:yes stop_codon:yes gene_type:complete